MAYPLNSRSSWGRLGRLFLALGFLGGAESLASGLGVSTFPVSSPSEAGALRVEVVDAKTGATLSDAMVTQLRSGAQFQVRVSRAGYVPCTVLGAEAGTLRVELREAQRGLQLASSEGLLEGWKPFRRDSVTAGAVFRSLSSSDLVWLDPSLFISPWKDTIDVFGARQIPSNVVIPRQTVDVGLGSLELNKPKYRLPLEPRVASRLVAVQGDARVSDLLPLFQGGNSGSGFEVLNQLHFSRVGLSSEWTPEPGEAVRETIETSLDLKPFHQVSSTAAPFAGDVLLAAMTDLSGDRSTLIPTDLKLGDARQAVTLSAPAQMMGNRRVVVGLAVSRPQDPNAPEGDPRRRRGAQISAVLSDGAGKQVRLPAFPAVTDRLTDFARTAPESLSLSGRSGGVGTLTLDSENETLGLVYVLPGAGTVRFALRDIGVDSAQVVSMDLKRFEFDGEFRPDAIDGESVLQRLARFTRSGAKKLP